MEIFEQLIISANEAQQKARRAKAIYLAAQIEEKEATYQLEKFLFSKEGISFKELLCWKTANCIRLSDGNHYEIIFNNDLTIKSLEPKDVLILPL